MLIINYFCFANVLIIECFSNYNGKKNVSKNFSHVYIFCCSICSIGKQKHKYLIIRYLHFYIYVTFAIKCYYNVTKWPLLYFDATKCYNDVTRFHKINSLKINDVQNATNATCCFFVLFFCFRVQEPIVIKKRTATEHNIQ